MSKPEHGAPARLSRRDWEKQRQEQTRQALLDAATVVFLRDGMAKATITAITTEAGVSQGSFYNYFRSKEEILLTRVHEAFQDPSGPTHDAPLSPDDTPKPRPVASYDDLYDRLERSHRRFFENYRENADLLVLLEHAEKLSPELRDQRAQLRLDVVEKDARFIRALQADGFADPHLDPTYTAHALSGMVGRFAHQWFIAGRSFDGDTAVQTMTQLWMNALGVPKRRRPKPRN